MADDSFTTPPDAAARYKALVDQGAAPAPEPAPSPTPAPQQQQEPPPDQGAPNPAPVPSPTPASTPAPQADQTAALQDQQPQPSSVEGNSDGDFHTPADAAARYQALVSSGNAPAAGTAQPSNDQASGEGFSTPKDAQDRFINTVASGSDDPAQLYITGQVPNKDAIIAAIRKRQQTEAQKGLGEKVGDAVQGAAEGAFNTVNAGVQAIANLPAQAKGLWTFGQNLGTLAHANLTQSGKSADELQAKAQADMEAGRITPEEFKAQTDVATKLQDLDRQQMGGEITPEQYLQQRAALVGSESFQSPPEVQRAARESLAGLQKAGTSTADALLAGDAKLRGIPLIGPLVGFGGGVNPTKQAILQESGINAPLSKSVSSMTDEELAKDLDVRRDQFQGQQAFLQGNVGAPGEAVLTAVNAGQPISSPEQLAQAGYEVRPQAVEGAQTAAGLAQMLVPLGPVDELAGLLGGGALWATGKTVSGLGTGVNAISNLMLKHPRISTAVASVRPIVLAATGNPHAAVESITHSLIGAGTTGAGKLVGPGLNYLGDVLTDSGNLAMGRASDIGEKGLIGQLAGRNLANAATGAATMGLYSLPGAESPEDVASAVATGGAFGGALGSLKAGTQSLRSRLFDSPYLGAKYDPKTAQGWLDYGTNKDLDAHSQQMASDLSDKQQQVFNDIKHFTRGYAETYYVDDPTFQKALDAGATVKGFNPGEVQASGIALKTGDGNPPQLFVRQGHFDDAFAHEVGHGLWDHVPPDSQNAFIDAASQKTDLTDFAQDYAQRVTGGRIKSADYDSLPTQVDIDGGAKPDPSGLTKDDVGEELGATYFGKIFKGQSPAQLTQNPSLLRRMKLGTASVLEKMGMPTATADAQASDGVQPSVAATLILDKFLREQVTPRSTISPDIQGASRPGVAPLTIGPVARGMRASEYFASRGQAGAAVPSVPTAANVLQNRQAVIDSLVKVHGFTAQQADQYLPSADITNPNQAFADAVRLRDQDVFRQREQARAAANPVPDLPTSQAAPAPAALPELPTKGNDSSPGHAPRAAQVAGVTTEDSLNKSLGGVLAGHGQDFIEMGAKYGIDPRLLAAISIHETANGSSHAVRTYNNVAGLMDPSTPGDRGFQAFGSIRDGIEAQARLLRRGYLDQGRTSIAAIGSKWAPTVGATNDPGGLNSGWASGVKSFYERLGGKGEPLIGAPLGSEESAAGPIPSRRGVPRSPEPEAQTLYQRAVASRGSERIPELPVARQVPGQMDVPAFGKAALPDLPTAGAPDAGYKAQLESYRQEHDADLGHAVAVSNDPTARQVLEERHGKTWPGAMEPEVQDALRQNQPDVWGDYQRRTAAMQRGSDAAQQVEVTNAQAEALNNKMGILSDVQTHGGLPSVSRMAQLETKHGENLGGEVERVRDAFNQLSLDAKRALQKDFGVTKGQLFSHTAKPLDILNGNLAQTSATVFDRPSDLLSHLEQVLSDYSQQFTPRRSPIRQPANAPASALPTNPVTASVPKAPPLAPSAAPATRELAPHEVQAIADKAARAVSTQTPTGKPKSPNVISKDQAAASNQAVLEAHNQALEPSDDRVRLHIDPDSGRQVVSGTRLSPDDAVHAHLLKSVPRADIDYARQWTNAIDQGRAVTLTYRGASASDRSHVAGRREAEYKADPAAARAAGESPGAEHTKIMFPRSVMIGGVKEPGVKSVLLSAISPDRLAQNFSHIKELLPGDHPAKSLSFDEFAKELGKYTDNHKAGYRGDGTAPLRGTPERPVNVDPTYRPQLLGERSGKDDRSKGQKVADAIAIGQVINAALHDTSARGESVKAKTVQGFVKLNRGYVSEGGETNPLRARLEKLWLEGKLTSPHETIRADNIIKFHASGDEGPAAIRSSSKALASALEAHGTPNRRFVAAGFLPDLPKRVFRTHEKPLRLPLPALPLRQRDDRRRLSIPELPTKR
jgi:hypothetical protein